MANNFLTTDALLNAITFHSIDTGNGIQLSQVVLSDVTGTPLSSTNKLIVDNSGVVQPISASALPLPVGASTSVKQPALGVAGTPSVDVLTVQGVTNMTPLLVTLTNGSIGGSVTFPTGSAGTANASALTIQGIANMTPIRIDGTATVQPVSAASLPLPTGASTAAKQPALGVAGTPSADILTVQGATNMTALKVDGSAVVQPVSLATVGISGTLPAFAAIPTVNLGTIGGAATGALQSAGNTILSGILTAIGSQRSETLWTDNTTAVYIRNDASGTISWTDVTGAFVSPPGTGSRPLVSGGSSSITVDRTSFQATSALVNAYAVGDLIDHLVTSDPTVGTILGHYWINVTQETKLLAAPVAATISPIPVGQSTAANQAVQITSLAAIASSVALSSTAALQTTGNTSLAQIVTGQTSALTANGTALALLHTDLTGTIKTAPQSNAPRVSATGSLANPGDTIQLAVDGMNTVIVQITAGSWIGTLSFLASVDNAATWFAINMDPFNGGKPVPSATVGGQWTLACGGLTHLRVLATSLINAVAPIVIAASTGIKAVRVGVATGNPVPTISSGSTGTDYSVNPATIPMSGLALLITIPVNLLRYGFGIQNQAATQMQIVRDDGAGANQTTILLPAGNTYTSSAFKGRIRIYGAAGSQVSAYED